MSFASGLITATSGSSDWTSYAENFQSDRESGLSNPDVLVTFGLQYKNKRDAYRKKETY